ncbi:MAG: arsenate reductase ArsC [Proteobacteria bacterium]|nr:arsenate reductase ArsC [Pseudomonadota bacterium]MBI3498828.1 arsenate reductase ArsC [Pseudomonadota bacterium]
MSMSHAEPRPALPSSVLFACTLNAVRSPMAEALLKRLHGRRVYVDSVGLRAVEVDPFAVAAMAEIGIDLSHHRPKTFDDLADSSFDLVVSLSPEAHHRALELTRVMACDVEYWTTLDASMIEGSRSAMLDAYRSVRDALATRIRARFPPQASPQV